MPLRAGGRAAVAALLLAVCAAAATDRRRLGASQVGPPCRCIAVPSPSQCCWSGCPARPASAAHHQKGPWLRSGTQYAASTLLPLLLHHTPSCSSQPTRPCLARSSSSSRTTTCRCACAIAWRGCLARQQLPRQLPPASAACVQMNNPLSIGQLACNPTSPPRSPRPCALHSTDR